MIEFMKKENLNQYATLFRNVFNSTPWNDRWTIETAKKRIEEMMNVSTFIGMAEYVDDKLVGVIFGRSEQYFDGVYFQIQEFFVDNKIQGQGIGTKILNRFVDKLEENGVLQIYLLTSKGEMTEDFYNRKGFITSNKMVLLYK